MAFTSLNLARQLANQLLQQFEKVRPGTEVFFHDVFGKNTLVRQRCTTLASAFSTELHFWKMALFNQVPFDSISLRDCTAKGEGVVIMWKKTGRYQGQEGEAELSLDVHRVSGLWMNPSQCSYLRPLCLSYGQQALILASGP